MRKINPLHCLLWPLLVEETPSPPLKWRLSLQWMRLYLAIPMQNGILTGCRRRWLRFSGPLWWLNAWRSSRPSTTSLIKWSMYPLMRMKCILTLLGTVLYSLTLSPSVIRSLISLWWKSFSTFIGFALLSSLPSSIRWLRYCWSFLSWLVSRSPCGI